MRVHHRGIVILLAALWLGLPPTMAMAQAEYVLTDEDEWSQVESAQLTEAEQQLDEVRRTLAARRFVRAEQLATRWIDRHKRHPRLPEAYLLRGDSLFGQEEYYHALFDYELVARIYPASDVFVIALERELDIARLFAGGLRRKLWGMRLFIATDEAEELLIRIQERLPGSRLAEQAGIELADFYFGRRQMGLAVDAYELFLENYPRSDHVDKARRRLIYAHLAGFKGPMFDAAGLYEARALLMRLKRQDPLTAEKVGADALIVRIDESDAQKLLVTAQWYLKTHDYIAAEMTLRRLVAKFPRSVATAEALRVVPDLLARLPESVVAEAPDYEAIRAGLAASSAATTEVAP